MTPRNRARAAHLRAREVDKEQPLLRDAPGRALDAVQVHEAVRARRARVERVPDRRARRLDRAREARDVGRTRERRERELSHGERRGRRGRVAVWEQRVELVTR